MTSDNERASEDIVQRLLNACVGYPSTTISWPHRLLHEAIEEITKLRALQRDDSVVEEMVEALEWYATSEWCATWGDLNRRAKEALDKFNASRGKKEE